MHLSDELYKQEKHWNSIWLVISRVFRSSSISRIYNASAFCEPEQYTEYTVWVLCEILAKHRSQWRWDLCFIAYSVSTDKFQYGNSLVLIAQLEVKIESTHKLCIVSKVWVKLNKMIQLHPAHSTYPYRLSVVSVSVSVCRTYVNTTNMSHTIEWPPANCLRFRCLSHEYSHFIVFVDLESIYILRRTI